MSMANLSKVVDEQSSLLGLEDERLIPVDATHSGICKFSGPSHSLFAPVLAQVKKCCQESPSVIRARFEDKRLPGMRIIVLDVKMLTLCK